MIFHDSIFLVVVAVNGVSRQNGEAEIKFSSFFFFLCLYGKTNDTSIDSRDVGFNVDVRTCIPGYDHFSMSVWRWQERKKVDGG